MGIIIIATFVTAVCVSFLFTDNDIDVSICLLGTVFGLAVMILALLVKNKPTAMDVYRGNTTLEITYKDSVAVDSIVVFK